MLTCIPGCLQFGNDIELKGDQIEPATLEQITATTGVSFPEGTIGMNYFFQGSGIDDALWFKASIPTEKKDEFLKNEIFSHKDEQPNHNMTSDMDWWKIDELKEASNYSSTINTNEFLGCSIGSESNEVIVCLLWFST